MTISIRSISSSCAMTSLARAVSRSSSARMERAMASSTIAPMRSRRCFNSTMSRSKWRCMSAGKRERAGMQAILGLVPERGAGERALDDLVELPFVAHAADAQAVGDVVVDRLREGIRFLEDHAHAAAQFDDVGVAVIDVLTV